MDREDSEVPLNLQHAIENAESDGEWSAMDLHPPSEWHDCPNCGRRLHVQSVIHDEKSNLIAVEYSCKCLSLWTWEPNTDELYYRGESELVDDV